MKKALIFLIILIGPTLTGQILTRKVLFLGNSYTYVNDLPQIVSDLATNTGDVLIYDSNLIGGYTLQNHFASTISKDKILSNDWDYIVLQEQSQRPSFVVPSAFMNGFSDLNNYITQNKPCAQITSFMTWGYANGDNQNCAANPAVCTYDGMQNLLTNRYMQMSDLYESEVTPVGSVWKHLRENYPTINLYQSDGSHPSLAGSYVAACSFYTSIFRKDPTFISNNYGLDASTASIIRNAVKSIVFDQMLAWYIGRYVPSSDFNYTIGNGLNEVIINNNTQTYRDSLLWDFGDGTTSTLLQPTHSYAADGNYIIKLTSYKCFLGQNLTSIFERTVNFCSHSNTIEPNYLILCPDVPGLIWTQAADSYQWCDFHGDPIPGATNQSLEVFTGLSYSVNTTVNSCTERSASILIDGYAGIGESPCNLSTVDLEKPLQIDVYPNPAQHYLNVQSAEKVKTISIIDLLGQEVNVNLFSANMINVSNLANGMYIIKVVSENHKTATSKFIKQ
jgi:PKD repeat protein